VPERFVERLVARGEWEELATGVYRSALARRPSFEQRLRALTLSVDGVAFGRSAAALYGLLPDPRGPEVLVLRGRRNRDRVGLHSTRERWNYSIPNSNGLATTGSPSWLVSLGTTNCPTRA
jgi:hypothetical protein